MIEDELSGRIALFWAPPRGRGPMPRSWRRWAFGQDGKHAGGANGSAAFVLVLHCVNTYKNGCSASEARQAVGGGRGAGSGGHRHVPRRGHPQACPVGGWLVHGGRDMHAATAFNGEVRMNYQDKPMPVASFPDNWSAFNDREVLPWQMSRADTAAVLQRARSLRARGQAAISVESVGRYRLSTFNTLILQTRRC